MSEHTSQVAVAGWLNGRTSPWESTERLLWTHHAAGYKRSKRGAQAAAAAGQRKGFPDVMVYEPPPTVPTARGTFVELKTIEGSLSRAQLAVHARLRALGWVGLVARSEDEAVGYLEGLGY